MAALQTSTKDLSASAAAAKGDFEARARVSQEALESAKSELAVCDAKLSSAHVEQARLQKLVKEFEGSREFIACSI